MKRKSYDVSSSDDDSTRKTGKTFDPTKKSGKTSDPTTEAGDHELLKDILASNKVQKLNFKSWRSCDTLFYNEIGADDELYLIQCPKNTDIAALSKANVDFDSAVSNIKCRVNESKEKLTVYSVDEFPSRVNLALPNRATKSFQLKALPVAGRLIMQKNIKLTRHVKTESESTVIDLEPASPKAELELIDEIKSESSTPKKKRS